MTAEWVAILLTGIAMAGSGITMLMSWAVKVGVSRVVAKLEQIDKAVAAIEREQEVQWDHLRSHGERLAKIEGQQQWNKRNE